MSSAADTLQAVVGLAIFGGGLLYTGFRTQKRVRQMQDTARTKSSSAAQGLGEFQGFAWPMARATYECMTPKRDCVYLSQKLQRLETRGSGKNKRKEWVTVWHQKTDTPFYLMDAGGLVVIEPTSAELDMQSQTKSWKKVDKSQQSKIIAKVNGSVSSFPPGKGFFGSLFAESFRIEEQSLAVGSPLFAIGHFSSQESMGVEVQEPGVTEFYKRCFDSNSKSEKKLGAAFDTNGDGKVSEKEARAGYEALGATAWKRTAGQTELNEEVRLHLHGTLDSTKERRLYLADQHEEHLVGKLASRMKWQLGGGSVVTALAILVLLNQFGMTPNSAKQKKMERREAQVQEALKEHFPPMPKGRVGSGLPGQRRAFHALDRFLILNPNGEVDYIRSDWDVVQPNIGFLDEVQSVKNLILVSTGQTQPTLQVVNLVTGKVEQSFPSVSSRAFLIGGSAEYVAIFRGNHDNDQSQDLLILDRKTKSVLRVMRKAATGEIRSFKLSADFRKLAWLERARGGATTIRTFDLGTPDRVSTFEVPENIKRWDWKDNYIQSFFMNPDLQKEKLEITGVDGKTKHTYAFSLKENQPKSGCKLGSGLCWDRFETRYRMLIFRKTDISEEAVEFVRQNQRDLHELCLEGIGRACESLAVVGPKVNMAASSQTAFAFEACRLGQDHICERVVESAPSEQFQQRHLQLAGYRCVYDPGACPEKLMALRQPAAVPSEVDVATLFRVGP